MITYSYQIWTFTFTVPELREMIKEASGDDLRTLKSILEEVQEFGDEEQILLDYGDENRAYSTSVSELETDTEDLIGFLQNQDFDNGDQWS